MTFHVFITTPRAGFPGVVTPYTVEAKEVYATKAAAQSAATAKVMSAGVKALLDAMPSAYPAWQVGSAGSPITYPAGTYRAHNGNGATWRCDQTHTAAGDPNFAPGIAQSLWTKVQPPGSTFWAGQTWYALPSQATDDGRLYQLLQAHRSQFKPAEVPALWQDIGAASGVQPYPRALWWVVDSAEPDYAQVNRAKETNGTKR